MDRSKKMIVGGVVATVVFIVVIVLVVRSNSSGNSCVPTKDKPDMKALKVNTIGSADKTALANLAGYVILEDKTYLPLDIETITVSKPDDNKSQTVTLSGKCVTVSVDYKKDTNYNYNGLKMLVKNSAKKDTEQKEICTFKTPFTFQQPITNYYSCTREQSHQCSDDKKVVVASLELKSFELELDTTEEAVKTGKFAKPAWTPSCDKWST